MLLHVSAEALCCKSVMYYHVKSSRRSQRHVELHIKAAIYYVFEINASLIFYICAVDFTKRTFRVSYYNWL